MNQPTVISSDRLPDNGRGPATRLVDSPRRILIVDSEESLTIACQKSLIRDGHDVDVEIDPVRALETASRGRYDIVLTELRPPSNSGLQLLRQLRESGIGSEVIISTSQPMVQTAVEAMQYGAADYLVKPFTSTELKLSLEKACRRSVLIRENAALRRELDVERGFEGILGDSAEVQRVFSVVQRVAPTEGTVLITGESGTGKEMIAKAIHRLSTRKDHSLIPCDCSALAPTLLESELFGHVKGSFSGAIAEKTGLFELASRGTLFLDEVANLSWETQGKLLRVFESRNVKKVGGGSEMPIDIRLIAATNQPLDELVEKGEFRKDLYYRLNVVPVHLPALRDRQGDIPLLATEFLNQFCVRFGNEVHGFTQEAMARMESYAWPGNVRELRNIVERIAILCDTNRVQLEQLPNEIRGVAVTSTITQLPTSWDDFKLIKQEVRDRAVADIEQRFLTEALDRCDGNISRTAKSIGIQRTNLHALLKKHKIRAKESD